MENNNTPVSPKIRLRFEGFIDIPASGDVEVAVGKAQKTLINQIARSHVIAVHAVAGTAMKDIPSGVYSGCYPGMVCEIVDIPFADAVSAEDRVKTTNAINAALPKVAASCQSVKMNTKNSTSGAKSAPGGIAALLASALAPATAPEENDEENNGE